MAYRSNEEWLLDLRGARGQAQQQRAHEELANYLYRVAYNYLELRQGDVPVLRSFAPEDQAALAQDFVQETLEKIARDNYALLDEQFAGTGRFVAWAARIVQNQARQELRKAHWRHRASFALAETQEDETGELREGHRMLTSAEPSPENLALQEQVARILRSCIEHLEERRRTVVKRCLVEEEDPKVAAELLAITTNAVYVLLHRAKKDLRNCLARAKVGADIFEIF